MKIKRSHYFIPVSVIGFAASVFFFTSDPKVVIIEAYTQPDQLQQTGLLNGFSIWCLEGWLSVNDEDIVVVIYPLGFYRRVDGNPINIKSR